VPAAGETRMTRRAFILTRHGLGAGIVGEEGGHRKAPEPSRIPLRLVIEGPSPAMASPGALSSVRI
jgi:hypothetical protein